MSNATLIKVSVVLATHLGETMFFYESFSQLIRPSDVSQWTTHTADQLSTEEHDMYLKAFQEQTIPDTRQARRHIYPIEDTGQHYHT